MTSVASPLDAIARLTADVGSAQTLPAVFDAALDGLRDAFGIDRASILLFDDDGVMRFKAWRDLSPEYRAAVEGHTPWSPGQAAPAPVVVSDIRTDISLAPYLPVFERAQIAALAFFPLVSDRGVIGKFMLYRGEVGSFTEEQVHAANAIGFVLGLAVERTQRLEDAHRERQRTLFALDAANMGTWEWDVRTQQVRWSDNLERIHGRPPGSFTGAFESYEREIHPEDRARVFASLQGALHRNTDHDVEYRIVAPDGTVRWVLGRGRVEYDGNGQPVRMTGVCMDVSARRQVQDEEAALRARLTTLTDGSYRLLTSLNAESVVSEVLALAARVVTADGYAVWRRQGNEWTVAGSQGLSNTFVSVRVDADPSGTPFEQPFVATDLSRADVLPHRAGAYRAEGIVSLLSVPLAIRGETSGSVVFYHRQPHQPSAGELQVAVALGHLAAAAISNAELYEQQRTLRQAAETAKHRSTLLAEASARLTSLDYEQNLREVAQLAVARLCDWCAVDLLNDDGTLKRVTISHVDPAKVTLAEEVHRRYPADLSEPRGLGHVLRTGVPELWADIPDSMLVQGAKNSDHLRILREVGIRSAMVVPLAARDRVFGVMSFVNSGESHRFDDQDFMFATELGRRAALAIDNARLYAEAQRASRLKDEFLATLSHELRTPLNVIAGRARMLAVADDVAKAREFAGVIDRNSATLTTLVDDLLDVSRMTIGQIRLDRQLVELLPVVHAAIQSVQSSADAKGIVFETAVDPDARVIGDAMRLQQIAWNLLTNAVKFTPAAGRIGISVAVSTDTVTLTVRDSGQGIVKDALPHIFDMFWQAEPSPARRQGGLGLGLPIVRRLAELHGGQVTAESAGVNHGTTFVVTLPRAARS